MGNYCATYQRNEEQLLETSLDQQEKVQTNKSVLEPFISNGRTCILDGGFGTEVEKKGFDINADDLWAAKCLDKSPDLVLQVNKEYLLSGSDIILTASYKASYDDFLKYGYTFDQATTLIKSSVSIAKQAREEVWDQLKSEGRPWPLVAASISSYGAFLYGEEYTGNYRGATDETLEQFHRKQIHLLAGEKPDILAIETLPLL